MFYPDCLVWLWVTAKTRGNTRTDTLCSPRFMNVSPPGISLFSAFSPFLMSILQTTNTAQLVSLFTIYQACQCGSLKSSLHSLSSCIGFSFYLGCFVLIPKPLSVAVPLTTSQGSIVQCKPHGKVDHKNKEEESFRKTDLLRGDGTSWWEEYVQSHRDRQEEQRKQCSDRKWVKVDVKWYACP